MDKKRELLAKTLLDLSKIMFVSIFANYLLLPNQAGWFALLLAILFVMIIGYVGWIVHPTVTERGER
jgi:uncharacterized iron-regulated membrane protein